MSKKGPVTHIPKRPVTLLLLKGNKGDPCSSGDIYTADIYKEVR